MLAREASALLHHFEGFCGNLAVHILALVIIVVDFLSHEHGLSAFGGGKKLYREAPRFHTAGSIDAGAYLENDVVHGDVPWLELGKVYHGEKPLAGVFI